MRFLFTVTDFDMGGITTSLKNLSDELIKYGHQVSILNLPGNTEFPVEFNPAIDFIPIYGRTLNWNVGIGDFKSAVGFRKVKLLFFGVLKKLLRKFGIWESYIFKPLSTIECDVAIAYRQSTECYYILKHKTTAKRTIAFIHSEFDGDCSSWIDPLDGIDRIACVSNDWSERFRKAFPRLASKVGTVYNLFDACLIKEKANAFVPEYSKDCFNIVTVARIETPQKKIETIPVIFDKIRDFSEKKVRWYIVGDGSDRNLVETAIKERDCENEVILLGAKKNPYPYVKNADLFVMTSSWESYGMVIMETLILGVPVVAGRYGALSEILKNPQEGIIAENSVQGIADAICFLLDNEDQYCAMKEYLKDYQYDPEVVYQQMMDMCK